MRMKPEREIELFQQDIPCYKIAGKHWLPAGKLLNIIREQKRSAEPLMVKDKWKTEVDIEGVPFVCTIIDTDNAEYALRKAKLDHVEEIIESIQNQIRGNIGDKISRKKRKNWTFKIR